MPIFPPAHLLSEPITPPVLLARAKRILWLGLALLVMAHLLPPLLPGNPHYDEPQVKHLMEIWKASGMLFFQLVTGQARAVGHGGWFGMGIGVSLVLFSGIALAAPMLAEVLARNPLARWIVTASCMLALLDFATITLMLWLTPAYYRGYVVGLAGLCLAALVTLAGLISLPDLRLSAVEIR